MQIDFSHLNALQTRLSNEKARLAAAKTAKEIEARTAIVASCEREIAGEYKFLGIEPVKVDDISDDDLFAELNA